VCKKVIEQHGGTIRVHSAPRLGTTFSLNLPSAGELE
jgi:signal transduction histidine kinase